MAAQSIIAIFTLRVYSYTLLTASQLSWPFQEITVV